MIDDAAVARVLRPAGMLSAIRGAFVDPPVAPPRTVAECNDWPNSTRAILAMPAVRPGGLAIVKVVTALGGSGGGLSSHLLVFGAGGEMVAVVEAHWLTAVRTAAASVLAAQVLGAGEARRLAVLGAERQARAHIEAYASAMPLEAVSIWARRPDAARDLAEFARQRVASVRIADAPADAAANADLIACATASRSPLLTGEMVSEGTHVDLVGGFRPDMREVDDTLMARAAIVADTPAAFREAGDLIQPIASGAIRTDDIALLGDVITGRAPLPSGEVTVFKSVGHGAEDLVAAELLLSRLGIGGSPVAAAPAERILQGSRF